MEDGERKGFRVEKMRVEEMRVEEVREEEVREEEGSGRNAFSHHFKMMVL